MAGVGGGGGPKQLVALLYIFCRHTFQFLARSLTLFYPQILGVLESALIAFSFSSLPVSLPSCSGAQLPPLQLPALMLSLKHVLPITALLQHFICVEHPLGRGVVFEEREVITDNSNKDNS